MIAATIEQAQKLIELGVDPSSADMMWLAAKDGSFKYVELKHDVAHVDPELDVYLSWSLSALLGLIPPEIVMPKGGTRCFFHLYHHEDFWQASYHDEKWTGDPDDYICQCMSQQRGEAPVEVCVMMIEWLYTNQYISTKQ